MEHWSVATRRAAAVFVMTALAPVMAVSAVASAAPNANEGNAEYALRWNPKDGGPKSAANTFDVLGLKSPEVDKYQVQYFRVTRPSDTPEGFEPIARKRTKKKKVELTYKYRGANALPASPPLAAWQCPLPSSDARKDEADISFVSRDQTKKVYSRSCSVESKAGSATFPASLQAQPKGCTSAMTRLKAKGVKVEEWKLSNGARVIEVSQSGKDGEEDLRAFRAHIVAPLLSAGVVPLDRSKSELGSECD